MGLTSMISFVEHLPNWVKVTCDVTAIGVGFWSGLSVMFGILATPLAALASAAAFVYTVLRTIQLVRDWNKKGE